MSTKTLSNGWQTDAAWSPIAEMSTERYEHAAVALNDNQCLVMGGANDVNHSWQHLYLSSVELYDKTTNTWTKLVDMKEKREYHAAAVVGNVVYAIGGWDGEKPLASMEVLDLNQPPRQRQWTLLKQPMTTGREGCAAAIVGRKIYVMGGWDDGPSRPSSSVLSSVEIFDTQTHEWSTGPSMTTARHGCAAVAIGTTIYAIGGRNGNIEMLETVECLNVLATGNDWKWTLLPQSMFNKRWCPAATVIGDCIAVVGGVSTDLKKDYLDAAELWDPKCQKWMSLPSITTARCRGAAVTLGTNVLVMGGHGKDNKYLSSGEQLHFPKLSSEAIPVPASSNTSTASMVTGDAKGDKESSLAEQSPHSKRARTTSPSLTMPKFQTRTELDAAISDAKVKLERARRRIVRLSPSIENRQAFQSIDYQLDELEHHREDIKDQFPTVEELQEEVNSLVSAFDIAMHNNSDYDQMEMLIGQLSLKKD